MWFTTAIALLTNEVEYLSLCVCEMPGQVFCSLPAFFSFSVIQETRLSAEPQMPTSALVGLGQSGEHRSPMWVVGNQLFELSHAAPYGGHQQEAEIRRQRWELNPGTLIWNTGIPSSVPVSRPNVCLLSHFHLVA